MEDFGLCLTLDAVPCPFVEVFVTLGWLNIWLVTIKQRKEMYDDFPLINAT